MARITVEDCLDKVDNRFQLVMISSKRARQIQIEGKEPMLPADKDKPTVIALREIADGLVDVSILNEKPKIDMELEEIPVEISAEQEGEATAETAGATEEGQEQAPAAEGEKTQEPAQQEEQPPEQA